VYTAFGCRDSIQDSGSCSRDDACVAPWPVFASWPGFVMVPRDLAHTVGSQPALDTWQQRVREVQLLQQCNVVACH
jgi:hypothetical protein